MARCAAPGGPKRAQGTGQQQLQPRQRQHSRVIPNALCARVRAGWRACVPCVLFFVVLCVCDKRGGAEAERCGRRLIARTFSWYILAKRNAGLGPG